MQHYFSTSILHLCFSACCANDFSTIRESQSANKAACNTNRQWRRRCVTLAFSYSYLWLDQFPRAFLLAICCIATPSFSLPLRERSTVRQSDSKRVVLLLQLNTNTAISGCETSWAGVRYRSSQRTGIQASLMYILKLAKGFV